MDNRTFETSGARLAVTARDYGAMLARDEPSFWAGAALGGVDILLVGNPALLASASPELALAVYSMSGSIHDAELREQIESWAGAALDRDPARGAEALTELWEGILSVKDSRGDASWAWTHDLKSPKSLARALETFLRAHPDLDFEPLDMLTTAAATRVAPTILEDLARAALARTNLPAPARALWGVILFALFGDGERARLSAGTRGRIVELLEESHSDGLLKLIPFAGNANSAARGAAIIRLLGPRSRPEELQPSKGRILRAVGKSDAVDAALKAMAANPDPETGRLLDECLGDPALASWRGALQHPRPITADIS